MDIYFAREADIMIDNVDDLDKDQIRIFTFNRNITKLSSLNVKLLFLCPSIYIFIVLNILGNIEISLFMISVTKVHGLDNHQ